MRSRVLALAALLALVAGCGATPDSTGDFEGAEREVAEVVEQLEEAAVEDQPRRVCNELLAQELVEQVDNCPQAAERALAASDTDALQVESVRVTGDTARARVATGLDEEQIVVFELTRSNGEWRISSLDAEQ